MSELSKIKQFVKTMIKEMDEESYKNDKLQTRYIGSVEADYYGFNKTWASAKREAFKEVLNEIYDIESEMKGGSVKPRKSIIRKTVTRKTVRR